MEKPLLVSGTLIEPIKKGLKTQTRRLTGLDTINQDPDRYKFTNMLFMDETGEYWASFTDTSTGQAFTVKSPYGGTGGILWVRENYYFGKGYDGVKPKFIPSFPHVKIGFMADGEKPDWAGKTRPAIHLPRAYCRILLNVQAVYIERLHNISEIDAEAEGIEKGIFSDGKHVNDFQLQKIQSKCGYLGTYVDGFKFIWMTLHGRESWNANPWVWVVKFNLKK